MIISKIIKNGIIKILDIFKLLPIKISFIVTFFLFFFDYHHSKSFFYWLFVNVFTLLLTALYFPAIYYFLDKNAHSLSKEYFKIYRYYSEKGRKYFRKQWRDILVEEIMFKFIPFFTLSNYFEINIIFLVLITGVLFSFIHKFNNPFSFLEFFIFFGFSHFLFIKTKSFAVLFIPHLFRNLILEYLIRNKDD